MTSRTPFPTILIGWFSNGTVNLGWRVKGAPVTPIKGGFVSDHSCILQRSATPARAHTTCEARRSQTDLLVTVTYPTSRRRLLGEKGVRG